MTRSTNRTRRSSKQLEISAGQQQQLTLVPTRAALYLRVSTSDQAISGLGIAAQRTRCRAMAEVKGWQVVAEYADEGISGTKDSLGRPELARILADCRAGLIDAVIILGLDRLGRKTRLVLDLVEQLAGYGVELVSCKESLDTTTATGKFVLTLFAGLAQLERDQTAERTTAALTELGNDKGYKGGRLPTGYIRRLADGLIEVEPVGAATVKRIFELRRAGMTMRAIAAELNRAGVSTGKGGQGWYASSVKEVLDNGPIYQGARQYASDHTWPVVL